MLTQQELSGEIYNIDCCSSSSDADSDSGESENEEEILTDGFVYETRHSESTENLYAQEQSIASELDYVVTVDDDQYLEVYTVDPTARLSSDDEEEPYEEISVNPSTEEEDDSREDNVDEIVADESSQQSKLEIYAEPHPTVARPVSRADRYHVNSEDNDVQDVDEVGTNFFKNNEQNGHVVDDVDEYFIKNTKINNNTLENNESTLIKNIDSFEPLSKISLPINETTTINEQPKGPVPIVKPIIEQDIKKKASHVSVTDPNALPHIEHIKKFLLEGLPESRTLPTKLCQTQRSCSLPHSPSHLPYFETNEIKTSLSFEDLNISELAEFSLNDMKKSETSLVASQNSTIISNDVKNEEWPKTLTEEDVNSFFIDSKQKKNELGTVICEEDDLNPQDMEIEGPIESRIQYPSPVVEIKTEVPDESSIQKTQQKSTQNVLLFCIEKTPNPVINKPVKDEIKVEVDDFVDVESFNETTVIPVLEANNLSSLLEQFEATEELNKNTRSKRSDSKPEMTTQKTKPINGLPNGMRLQDAAVQLNKNKIKIMVGIFCLYFTLFIYSFQGKLTPLEIVTDVVKRNKEHYIQVTKAKCSFRSRLLFARKKNHTDK